METFFTAEKANEGIKLDLYHPVTQEKTEHSIWIRGVDSDEFRRAKAASFRRLAQIAGNPNRTAAKAELDKTSVEEEMLDVQAALVIKWTFKEECTLENIKKLFKKAPQILDYIDRCANERSLFLAQGSNSSTPSPEASSS